jgi:exonuclease SbcD
VRRLNILHFSDLHLGIENYSRIDPATGLPTRLLDYLASLDEVIDAALRDRVDLVLFTGDMYKNRDPSPTHQRELAKRIARLVRGGVPIFLLVGNHDLPNSPVRAHSIEIFDTLALERVHVGAAPSLHRIDTPAGPVQIVALPWVPRSRLIKQEDSKNLTLDELNGLMRERLSAAIQAFSTQLDPAIPSILAAHAQVSGAKFGSERSATLGQDYVLSLADLGGERFDYIALGHMHQHQRIPFVKPAVYAGSIQRTDFGEEGETKGYLRVSIGEGESDRPVEWRFVESRAARSFFTLAIDARTADDPTERVLSAIERSAKQIARAIVRLQIQLTAENEARLRDADIRRALAPAYYVAAIARNVERGDRRRLPDVLIEQLSPHDALSHFLVSKGVDPERREVLLRYADQLIAET